MNPHIPNNFNEQPIHYACEQGAVRIIKMLLGDRRVDIAATDFNGDTPMHYSVRANQTQTFKMLLRHSKENNLNLEIIGNGAG